MGRDFLGDDLPPDEINIILEGQDYGWPYCYGKRVHDDQFDPEGLKRDFCKDTVPSFIDIPAHSAPLGLAFFPEEWPKEYRYNLLVAYHGSWNRTAPTGYKVVRFKLDRRQCPGRRGLHHRLADARGRPGPSGGYPDHRRRRDLYFG